MCDTFLSNLHEDELKELLYECIEELSIADSHQVVQHSANAGTFNEIETIISHIKNRCMFSVVSNNQNEELLINMPWTIIQTEIHKVLNRTPAITELVDMFKNAPYHILSMPIINGELNTQCVVYYLRKSQVVPINHKKECA